MVRYFISVLLFIVVFTSCRQLTKATDFITNPSAREVYARDFESDSIFFPKWKKAFDNALFDSVRMTLPYLEKGLFRPANTVAYSYNVELYEGENLQLSVKTDSLYERVFLDIFLWDNLNPESSKKIAENKPGEKTLQFYVEAPGTYKIIIQPEMSLYSNFELVVQRTPSYAFPVSGKGNEAIQSFWGAPRGGGTRTHKGIDIFAKRGTPVIAIVDGRTAFVGERGLGGKQVWLREGLLGNSLYYAHLDSMIVQPGQKVFAGDTLGFVGNTGNARYTPPHLHFGIYKRIGGAVDPLPFVKKQEPLNDFEWDASVSWENGVVQSSNANLRISNSSKSKKIGNLKQRDSLIILGVTENWLHILTDFNKKAFVYKSLVER